LCAYSRRHLLLLLLLLLAPILLLLPSHIYTTALLAIQRLASLLPRREIGGGKGGRGQKASAKGERDYVTSYVYIRIYIHTYEWGRGRGEGQNS